MATTEESLRIVARMCDHCDEPAHVVAMVLVKGKRRPLRGQWCWASATKIEDEGRMIAGSARRILP